MSFRYKPKKKKNESSSSRVHLPQRKFADFQFLPFQKIPDLQLLLTPRSAWTRLATPPHAFPVLNVQIGKQPDASGVFLLPRADAREGMPLKTLVARPLGVIPRTLLL
ncbi:unnamed protein product [Prunus armeniaca]